MTAPARARRAAAVVVFAAVTALSSAFFYLPGIAPNDFEDGKLLYVYANKLTSVKNFVPYDYYSGQFCKSSYSRPNPHIMSLGQLLEGERSELTNYKLHMNVPESCLLSCERNYNARDEKRFTRLVRDSYRARMTLDNLPIIVRERDQTGNQITTLGVRIGYIGANNATCLFNHLRFHIKYHVPQPLYPSAKGAHKRRRIVGFEVLPMSVLHKHKSNGAPGYATCPVSNLAQDMCLKKGQNTPVSWTYDVEFQEDKNLEWATRWDPLLTAEDSDRKIQWFVIINSTMITLFLTAMVAMILLRTVYLDFARYNNIDDDEEIQEESGWKLIHGDVFRPPAYSGLLCVAVGSGAQILCMGAVTLVFALIGFLSPANRGGLLTAMLSLWVLASTVCGYWAARVYAGLQGVNKRGVTLGSVFLFSGLSFAVFFALNLIMWASGSSGAVPFFTLLLLLVMWFGISVPLNIIGAFIGYKQKAYEYPVRTNQIPREIPHASRSSNVLFSLFSGILPFGVVFIELIFILRSIYNNRLFYFFGFVGAVFLILIVTCAEVSVVLTYLQLSKESYHWWWPSFMSTASSGLYVFMYSLYFLYSRNYGNRIHIVSSLIFIGYTFVCSLAFALATGCIGFFASFKFVRKIYASVHID